LALSKLGLFSTPCMIDFQGFLVQAQPSSMRSRCTEMSSSSMSDFSSMHYTFSCFSNKYTSEYIYIVLELLPSIS